MGDVIIRKFKHTDVDDFLRLSRLSFAEESIAAGITPEDFELETRRIFRWKMIPYKFLTQLMGIKWEGFVAEKDGKVVGGGMYMGRNNRMVLTNLMVDPEFRRQGIGQALLLKRLERLSELGFPYVTTQVLDTNSASLANIEKQDFKLFNQYSVYERSLPITDREDPIVHQLTVREIKSFDKTAFREIEKRTTPAFVLHINGSAEARYFLSNWQNLYHRYARYSKWIKAVVAEGETLGFLCADFHPQQRKGFLLQPVVGEEGLRYLPTMIQEAGAWLEESGKDSMVVEIPDQHTRIRDYLLDNGWSRQYTWLEFIKWLDERARQIITSRSSTETG
jgi:ribosomal protein S18 acetylase RimI-like enzyme